MRKIYAEARRTSELAPVVSLDRAFRRNFDVNCFGLLNAGGVVNMLTVVALARMPNLGVYTRRRPRHGR